MDRTEKIRIVYGTAVGAAVIALGIALICLAADIYYSGAETGVYYTREIVGEKLMSLSVPFIVLIGAIACGAAIPLADARAKRRSETAIKLLEPKMPSGGGAEFSAGKRTYEKTKKVRYALWGCALGVALACAVASLCYLLNAANFPNKDISAEMLALVRNVLPWAAVSFVALAAVAVADGVLAARQLALLKKLIKCGEKPTAAVGAATDGGAPAGESKPRKKSKILFDALSSNAAVWTVRACVIAVAIVFITVGALNGGANDVLVKAINICTECIGLG